MKFKHEMKRAAAYAEDLTVHCAQYKFVPTTGRNCPPPPHKRRKTCKGVKANVQRKRDGVANSATFDYDDDKVHVNLHNKVHNNSSAPSTSFSTKSHKSGSFHVGLFGQIQNLLKCSGCGNSFTAVHRKPPHDLILKNFHYRRYINKSGVQVKSPHLPAAYYHLKLNCTRRVEPRMELSDIIVHDELLQLLTNGHKQLLMQFGVQC